jgi:hypothetical protein
MYVIPFDVSLGLPACLKLHHSHYYENVFGLLYCVILTQFWIRTTVQTLVCLCSQVKHIKHKDTYWWMLALSNRYYRVGYVLPEDRNRVSLQNTVIFRIIYSKSESGKSQKVTIQFLLFASCCMTATNNTDFPNLAIKKSIPRKQDWIQEHNINYWHAVIPKKK